MSVSGLLRRFCGFSLIGFVNTALSMGLIVVLADFLGIDCRVSYASAYAATVVTAYAANARLVFHVPLSFRGLLGFSAVYLAGLVLGVVLLHLAVMLLGDKSPVLLSFAVLAVTTAFNFMFVSLCLRSAPIRTRGQTPVIRIATRRYDNERR